ncbi:MAG: hypothetical protein OXT03_00990 [Alphaproteobacteria bacterium]|nr:hypothetical protein [Alphaproteobacteria bacterium]
MRGIMIPENMQNLNLSPAARDMLTELTHGPKKQYKQSKQPEQTEQLEPLERPEQLAQLAQHRQAKQPPLIRPDLPIMQDRVTPQPLAAPFAESHFQSEIVLKKQKIKKPAPSQAADALIDLLGQLDAPIANADEAAQQDEKTSSSMFEEALGAIIDDANETTEEEMGENENANENDMTEEETQATDALTYTKSNLKTVTGVKHVRKTFEQQSFGSPFLKTIILIFALLLVAALPPAVNLFYIQPIITDNNSKLSEISLFKSQTIKDTRQADKLLVQLKSTERNMRNLATKLSKQDEFESLYNHFLTALENYNVKIIKKNSTIDKVHSVVIGTDKKIEIKIIDLEVETRFDIYRAIREIFIKEASSVTILEERITAAPNKANLRINLKIEAAYLKEV